MPIQYTPQLGELIYNVKLINSSNEYCANAIYEAFGEYPSSYRRIREWHNRYRYENGLSEETDHYTEKVGWAKDKIELDEYEDIQLTFERYIASSYKQRRPVSMGIIGDGHLGDENPTAWALTTQLLNIARPDVIIYNGDLLDLSTESRYPSSHKAMATDTLSMAWRKFDTYRSHLNYNPTHEFLVVGNHDVRFKDCLSGMSASIRNSAMRDFNTQLEKRNLLFGGWDTQQLYYRRQLLVQHGDGVGVNTSRNNLLKAGYGFMLSVFGHAHKHQDSVQTSLAGEFASVATGGLQNKKPEWGKSKAPANWQYGMCFVVMDGEDVMPVWDNVKFSEKGKKLRCLFGGELIEVGQ